MLLTISLVKKLLERFMKKNCKKQQEFRVEKVIKEKETNYMPNGKVMIIHLIVGFMKMILYKNESILFLNHMNLLEETLMLKLILSNYATKTDLKNAARIDTSKLAAKSNLVSLKAEVDKLDIDKLVLDPVDFSKLSDIVKK